MKVLTQEQYARLTPAERLAYFTQGLREVGEALQRQTSAWAAVGQELARFVEAYGNMASQALQQARQRAQEPPK